MFLKYKVPAKGYIRVFGPRDLTELEDTANDSYVWDYEHQVLEVPQEVGEFILQRTSNEFIEVDSLVEEVEISLTDQIDDSQTASGDGDELPTDKDDAVNGD